LEETLDILRLLDEVTELAVERPRRIIGKIYWGLDPEEVQIHLAKVRASLPNELKQAVQTVRESERIVDSAREDATMTLDSARKEADRILNEARREAEKIVEHAKMQQERMIHESEVLKLAKAQAEEIKNNADREALQMRRGADKYASDVLGQLESVIGRALTSVEKGRTEMERVEQAAVQAREKARA
jgi:cell division septum initiation protein DivIVA